MSVRRGTNELFEDGVERMARSPAGRRAELRRATDERRDIRRANERRIRLQFRVCSGEGKDAARERRPCRCRRRSRCCTPRPPRRARRARCRRARRLRRGRNRESCRCSPSRADCAVPRSATARRTSAGITKLGDWPGPVWLNGRTAITRTPPVRCASSASTSCAALEAA